MDPKLKTLFSPFQVGPVTLRNRTVMAPMTRSHSPNGVPRDDVAAYYKRRAEGGVGLIISEGTTINHRAANGYPDVPRFYGDDALAGWKKILDGVHAAGAKMVPQLWHVGLHRELGMGPISSECAVGPVDIVRDGTLLTRGLKQAEINEIINAYGQAASDAKNLGFDGVEIHGAHQYLIDQFFWDETNTRTDQYGGSIENRVRFATEIVVAIRAAVGPDFPIIFRFSQWKLLDYTAKIAQSPEDLSKILLPLSEAGVDVFHASTRRFWEPAFDGSDLNLAGWAKKITGKPSISVGSVGLNKQFAVEHFSGLEDPTAETSNIDDLCTRLNADEFDLVGIGRALLADSQWVNKVKTNRFNHINAFDEKALTTLT
jgi:2,4-dienoyl-CoA reductase-like NADH-dependent reductase (Old Yellow Enzyme family)